MATYTVNQPGSPVVAFPASLQRGDVLLISNTRTGPSGDIISWTVQNDGEYKIEAYGAEGGNSGGKGAKVQGNFNLKKGQVIKILIGQMGGAYTNSKYGTVGGGGGTFLADSQNAPLIIAGGGGGFNKYQNYIAEARPGTSSVGDSSGAGFIKEGYGGNGGSVTGGSGGSGFYGDGNRSSYGYGGKAFINGGIGGNGYNAIDYGGYGGGGGGGGGFSAGGGGGGYTGGGGGGNASEYAAGGGGSFNKGNNQSTVSGYNRGHGKVEITFIGSANEPPTKPSLTKQPISNSMNLSNEIIPLGWTASTDPEGNPITYEIDFYNGSAWVSIATKITATKYDCILPSVTTDKAQLRIRATDSENGASEYVLSNVFIVAKQLYVIKDGDINKSYKNGNWEFI
ncbi:hypothetical protein CN498_22020 [Bacillus thuringiensis]|uniref:Fibronectin type-III domain-containing protein n=1 Tax=Bacillus cereus (strain G9842) TaxID=405531 RepID=B7IZI9_BACC2|nr:MULTISPECIES: glycine-rich protein [Bacillus cereus group]ACK98715.1 conserved hypothetical protein [Bacillus cereus G9842]MDR4135832.1 hypothetical protein [Bacillus cereus]MDR4363561.1 hypothetical protein [Bacillus cereus]PER85462.1 hypothetical protein CN498_22020 [Bacillus thuringiensis]